MKNVFFFFGIFLTLFCAGCGDDDNVENGNLSGSTWKRDVSDKSSVSEYNFTETISFSSDKKGAYTRIGDWKVYSSSSKKWNYGTYNDNNSFTYIYSPDLKQGVYTYSSGKQMTFTISNNYKTLSTGGGSTYNRK